MNTVFEEGTEERLCIPFVLWVLQDQGVPLVQWLLPRLGLPFLLADLVYLFDLVHPSGPQHPVARATQGDPGWKWFSTAKIILQQVFMFTE